MAIILQGYFKYLSIVIILFAILYQYEIPFDRSSSDKNTLLLTKKATLQYNRSYVFKIITNIDKYVAVCY